MQPPAAPVPMVCGPRRARTRRGRFFERLLSPVLQVVALAGALFAIAGSRLQMAGPGVLVEAGPAPGPPQQATTPGAALFLVGLTDRGPDATVATVRSYSEFLDRYGPYVSYGALHDQARIYFQMGGTRLHVARVVGASATKGTLTLQDRNGTPASTLKIDAMAAGAWSADVDIQIADGDLDDTYTIFVWVDDELKETYPNLASPAAAVTALSTSQYVTATDLASGTAAPDDNPDVLAKTPLSAGSDDRAAVNAAALTAALDRFTTEHGDGAVAIPGQDSTAVGAGLLAHAQAFSRTALLAAGRTASISTAKTAAAALNNTGGNEHALLAYPWIKVDDQAGGQRSISPEGYVAGARARAHAQVGPWRAGAGDIAAAPQILGVETELTETQGAELNEARVSAIRRVGGRYQLYGYRSLSLDGVRYRFLTTRDVVNHVAHQGKQRLQPLVFGTIDSRGHFQKACETAVTSILEPMLNAGGLYELRDPDTGEIIDSAYEVDAGPSVNPPSAIAEGTFTVLAAFRPAGVAEKIQLRITAVAFEENI